MTDVAAGLVVWVWLAKAVVVVFAVWGLLAPLLALKILELLRQLKEGVMDIEQDVKDLTAAVADLTGRVDAALLVLASAPKPTDPAVLAAIEAATAALKGESAKVDAVLNPPAPVEPPVATTEG